MSQKLTEISKFLSYILRHEPESIGLHLDSEGWAEVAELIRLADQAGRSLNEEIIKQVVATSDKKRFSISEDGLRIRAAQGHSTQQVKISYSAQEPPELLYHGTATRFLDSILAQGLKPGQRQHVHLSADIATASAVGQRYGQLALLTVRAKQMHQQGMAFYQADNGVWLTEKVPVEFIAQA